MSINIYPSIAKVKRNGVYENLPGFVQQSGDADIEAMIATKESDTLAQYPHPQGSYFILNDVLYQADVDIPVSGTIAVGTNCHVAVLSDALGKFPPISAAKTGKDLFELYTANATAKITTDGANITKAGKNLFKSTNRVSDKSSINFGTLTSNSNGELTITGGTASAVVVFYFNTTVVAPENGYFIPKGTYTLSIRDKSTGESPTYGSNGGFGLFYWYTDDLTNRLAIQWNYTNGSIKTFTLTKDALIIPFINFNSNVEFSPVTLQFQLEKGSSATYFENSVVEVINSSSAEINLPDRTSYLWSRNSTYIRAEFHEQGVVNPEYQYGDVRRYGIFPDGITNWQNTSNMNYVIANSINLGMEMYWCDGYYATQINIGRSNVTMRFSENAEFGGLIHIVSPYSQSTANPRVGEHPIKNITIRGRLQTYSRYGQTDTENVFVEKIHLLSDDTKNIDIGRIGGGAHIYWGNNNFWCDEIVADDADNTEHTLDAAISIDGYGDNPKNFHIGKIHIKDSSVHGLYLTGTGHWIGEVTVDAFGYGEYYGSGLQDSNGLAQSQELCGVWLNRIGDSYIGKISVNQALTGTRTNAKYSVRVDETGIASFAAIKIGEISAYSVKDNNRGVMFGDVNYDPPRCYADVGTVLVSASGNGDATYGMLTLSEKTAVHVSTLYTTGLGNRQALLNDSNVSTVGLQVS